MKEKNDLSLFSFQFFKNKFLCVGTSMKKEMRNNFSDLFSYILVTILVNKQSESESRTF
jgi:hypothetical protein